MTISANKLKWEYFSSIHKDKNMAFEDMCRALFLHEFCDEDTPLLHSNPNNPGIETLPVFSKKYNARIGFQAKFFDNKPNYSQIKQSAQQTIKYYKGQLDKYVLFCNKDIKESLKSYKSIVELLKKYDIEVILCSNKTIFDLLQKHTNVAVLYFNTIDFSSDFFYEQVQNSLNELGRRYNQSFNIDTDTQEKLDLFLMGDKAINNINNKKKEILQQIENMFFIGINVNSNFLHNLHDYIKALPDIYYNSRKDCFNWAMNIREVFKDDFEQISIAYEDAKNSSINNNNYNKYKNLGVILSLPKYLSFYNDEKTMISNNILFLKGETGIGKSQLLSVIAKEYILKSKPVLFLLGHKFSNYHDLDDAILKQSNLENISFDDFLLALNELGIINNQPSILLIDAINETDNIKLWKHNLTCLTRKIRKFDNIRLIISYRNDYEKLLLDDNIFNDLQNNIICCIEHYGLTNKNSDAISDFLEKYSIPFNPEYYLQSNIYNPLYLTWFCQYINGYNHNRSRQ